MLVSVESVLATALPLSLLSIAITNPNAVASIISSEFAAGETPAWYSSLPANIKSYLTADAATAFLTSSTPAPSTSSSFSASAYATSTPATTPAPTVVSSGTAIASLGSVVSSLNSTFHSATLSTSTKATLAASTGASAAATAASTGAASLPTAVIGAGLAGALSMLGMLVL